MKKTKDFIIVKGARVHNLKNINVRIPRNKLVVITGVSGSGKSSLAFDTLYAEGQRRYVESLSAYARQFLGIMQKPRVDKIEGISPAISIDQRKAAHNPRSTVGTITEIYDYLRLLFARAGEPHCPKCGRLLSQQTVDQIGRQVLKLKWGTKITILAPLIRQRKGEHRGVLEEVNRQGFVRVRVDGIVYRIEEAQGLSLSLRKKHDIEVVVDRLVVSKDIDKIRLIDSIETALKAGKGVVIVNTGKEDLTFSEHLACEKCGISLPEITPRLFSFNSPYGACLGCTGLGENLEPTEELVIPYPELSILEGAIAPWAQASHRLGRQGYFNWQLSNLSDEYGFSLDTPFEKLLRNIKNVILYGDEEFEGVIPNLKRRYHETQSEYTRKEISQYMEIKKCPLCHGKRLRPEALAVTVTGKTIDKIVETPIDSLEKVFEKLSKSKASEKRIVRPILKEILSRLGFLKDVGLNYLTLDRKAETLSAGEAERIRLATQIGSKLTGILYILDEPSIGLHARDQARLIKTLKELRDLQNTVIVVEHDQATIKSANWIIDLGPGAGKNGGKITFKGTPKALLKSKTLTGDYLSGRKKVEIKKQCSKPGFKQQFLVIKGAQEHNLKNIDVKIPLNRFVCVTGVSGSGKSTLVNDILARALKRGFYKSKRRPGKHKKIVGTEFLDKVVLIDQSPIGRTPRSNPATYTGVLTYIRELFAQTREAKARGYKPGRFSFNIKEGRCEACQGQGTKKVEMYFLPDVYVVCQECKGKRYNEKTLEIEYKGKNIADILKLTVEEALEFFKNIPGLSRKLKILDLVGLGYLQLGQPSPFLSGGEAQRIKLARELSKKATGNTLYILDEPTTGLHPDDIKKLIFVLKTLVARGNTVLIIEHELNVIRNSDWCVDLGPEGGDQGGYIVAEGTPHDIIKNKKSYTGKYLKSYLL